jgi:hypothetical protein
MCALCRRNLLAGERYRLWQGDPDRQRARDDGAPAPLGASPPRPVCGLCEPDAGQAGLVRAVERVRQEPPAGASGTVRLVA